MKYAIILLLTTAFLGGCASRWNAKTCASTNFGDLGYQEGSSGQNTKVDYYNLSCMKRKVQIPVQDYNQGYQRGLAVFCSSKKGYKDGSQGVNVYSNCSSISAYTTAHRKGLKKFCSTEKGVRDGFAMQPETVLCTSFSAYTIGYKKGQKNYCTSDRGYEHGFAGQNQDNKCVIYSTYKRGYAKGQKYFCSPENGTKLGEKGSPFPQKCEKSGRAFERNYNKGRVKFLSRLLREKETSITFERQNYERVRDELQDTQFALGRLPKYSTDPNVEADRDSIESKIINLKTRRDTQRRIVEGLEGEVYDMKTEINRLRNY